MFDKKPKDNFCPFIKDECIGEPCKMFTHIRGVDKNTGQDVDKRGCSIEFIPMLIIENNQNTNSIGAAIESLRNETLRVQNIVAVSNVKDSNS